MLFYRFTSLPLDKYADRLTFSAQAAQCGRRSWSRFLNKNGENQCISTESNIQDRSHDANRSSAPATSPDATTFHTHTHTRVSKSVSRRSPLLGWTWTGTLLHHLHPSIFVCVCVCAEQCACRSTSLALVGSADSTRLGYESHTFFCDIRRIFCLFDSGSMKRAVFFEYFLDFNGGTPGKTQKLAMHFFASPDPQPGAERSCFRPFWLW